MLPYDELLPELDELLLELDELCHDDELLLCDDELCEPPLNELPPPGRLSANAATAARKTATLQHRASRARHPRTRIMLEARRAAR